MRYARICALRFTRISANCIVTVGNKSMDSYGFVVIDKDSLRIDNTEKDLMSIRYLNA